MSPEYGYRIEQLMELAGLSVSHSVFKSFPVKEKRKGIIVCGPGNNGGDGLVCARHLYFFGYDITVWQPKIPKRDLFKDLNKQCEILGINILSSDNEVDLNQYDFLVDGIFGFSFKGSVRSPFDNVLKKINMSKIPKLSIDIPSGWDVEKGNVSKEGIEPNILISLTAPKLCAKYFKGVHFLGGRFVPEKLDKHFSLNIPKYKDTEQVIEL